MPTHNTPTLNSTTIIATLAICITGLVGCHTQPEVLPPLPPPATTPIHTAGMGSVHTWTGRFERRYSITSPHWDTVSIYPDSTFALTITGPDSVSAFNTAYGFDTTDTVQGIRYFGRARNFYTAHSGDGIAYFYNSDSITIIRFSTYRNHFEEREVWTTKPFL